MPNFINNKISLVRHKIQQSLFNNYTSNNCNGTREVENILAKICSPKDG